MEIIKENLGVQLPDTIITENYDFLSEICQKKIDLKTILSMIYSYRPGSDQYHLLILIHSLLVYDVSKNTEQIKYLLEHIGFLMLRFMNITKETTPFVKGDSLNDIDFESEEYKSHCESVSQFFWVNNHMSETIRFFYLSLVNHFLTGKNLFDAQPYLLIDEKVSVFRFVCGVGEMVHIFFMLLGEYYQQEKIDHDDFRYPETMNWIFDNPNNPIETPIRNYAMSHGIEITKTDSDSQVKISYEGYHQLAKETYNTDSIIHKIQSELSQNKILEKYYQTLDDPLPFKKFIIALTIFDFLMLNISEMFPNN